ncbi:hypothetical protein ACPXCS_31800 [Streptomyces sp. DT190]|jgi:hypothetical protein|uniref:hypothetical protein n=1 Tax=unclassified Streptomyces TaxID=2593676 RepID=UPI003CF3CD2F
MPEDTGVFARFVAARRADPDRLQVPAQPLSANRAYMGTVTDNGQTLTFTDVGAPPRPGPVRGDPRPAPPGA